MREKHQGGVKVLVKLQIEAGNFTKNVTFFHVFKTEQMLPNRAELHNETSKNLLIYFYGNIGPSQFTLNQAFL